MPHQKGHIFAILKEANNSSAYRMTSTMGTMLTIPAQIKKCCDVPKIRDKAICNRSEQKVFKK